MEKKQAQTKQVELFYYKAFIVKASLHLGLIDSPMLTKDALGSNELMET